MEVTPEQRERYVATLDAIATIIHQGDPYDWSRVPSDGYSAVARFGVGHKRQRDGLILTCRALATYSASRVLKNSAAGIARSMAHR